MSATDWRAIAEETHAKLLAAREQLARVTSDKHQQYRQGRDELVRALRTCVEALSLASTPMAKDRQTLLAARAAASAALSRAGFEK